MLQEKQFSSNAAVVAATNAYFESKDNSLYKKRIEMLEKRWNNCITIEGTY